MRLVAKIGTDRFGSIIEALLAESASKHDGSIDGGAQLTDHLLRDKALGSSYTIVINPCVMRLAHLLGSILARTAMRDWMCVIVRAQLTFAHRLTIPVSLVRVWTAHCTRILVL